MVLHNGNGTGKLYTHIYKYIQYVHTKSMLKLKPTTVNRWHAIRNSCDTCRQKLAVVFCANLCAQHKYCRFCLAVIRMRTFSIASRDSKYFHNVLRFAFNGRSCYRTIQIIMCSWRIAPPTFKSQDGFFVALILRQLHDANWYRYLIIIWCYLIDISESLNSSPKLLIVSAMWTSNYWGLMTITNSND